MTFAAAVFDLDGVITFTARVHAAAWKELFDDFLGARAERAGEPFRPFTQNDYRTYVDGRPRYDGVRTFLESRAIELPLGDPSDDAERETMCGLGNRKNLLFRQRLAQVGAEVDTAAVNLVRELRSAGVRVGVASSSENTTLILERAGLLDLFQAQVDGIVSERLQLQGKPAPDIFLKCLELLGAPDPQRALVAEDAEVGVEAGRAGGFGLVLGVDRGERAIALREHGADWIVRDFAALSIAQIESYFENRAHVKPNALAHWAELAERMQRRQPAVFLDYDGTLTPIVARPELARLSDVMRATLRRVAAAWPTTVVSGRGRADVQTLVGIDELHYAGSHGFDIAGAGVDGLRFEVDPTIVPALSDAAAELESSTAGIPGILVENKRFSVAVHYRLVPEQRIADVERAVDAVIAARPQLRKQPGKKIFELRPALDWDKGRAVLWLLQSLGLDGDDAIPIYIGDDTTDEDAFRALEGRGIGILVADVPRPTAASHSLQDVEEVRVLLDRLALQRKT